MGTNHDNLIFLAPAFNLADYVYGIGTLVEVGLHIELHLYGDSVLDEPNHAIKMLRGQDDHRRRQRVFGIARSAALAKNGPSIARCSATADHCYGSFLLEKCQQLLLELAVRISPAA